MNREREILQHRIQIIAIGHRRRQAHEWIRGKQRKGEEPETDDAQHAEHTRAKGRRQESQASHHRDGPEA